MLQTAPPPISMDKLVVQLALLPSLSMHGFWALWDQYCDVRPRRRSRMWLEGCLARKIQEVAFAEYEMELRVARKLERAARMRVHRKIQRGDCALDVPQDEDINAQISGYLTLCPDLSRQEALWLVCRVRPLKVAWSGLSPDCDAPDADPAPSRKPVAPTQAC